MVIDAFIFYNELDLLEFRLEELYDHVDYFVISEATITHKGNPKELYFEKNKERFSKYLDKIVYVLCDDMPIQFDETKSDEEIRPYFSKVLGLPKTNYKEFWDFYIPRHVNTIIYDNSDWRSWLREILHRQSLMKGIVSLNPQYHDIVMITDVDEIPDVDLINIIKNNGPEGHHTICFKNQIDGLYGLLQRMYYYNLECKYNQWWHLGKIMNYGTLEKIGCTNAVRWVNNTDHVKNSFYGGWHFSNFMDVDQLINKIKNYSHQEFNTKENTNREIISERMQNNVDIFGRDRDTDMKMFTHVPFERSNYWPKKVELLIELYNFPYKY